MPQEMQLNVNGEIHRIEVEPETPLLYVLRNDLGLKAAKFACGTEQCGACKVIIDGYAVNSCRLPVRMMQGRQITTLEGLVADGELHPLQQAFIDQQALQCGFCTSGMIVAAKALLDRKPTPTDGEIRTDLRQNLCRCGVYDRVRRAIVQASGGELAPAYELRPGGAGIGDEKDARAQPADLPESLVQNPDLDTWLRFNEDETVTLFPGKVEFGQGILTAAAQIAAEELDVSIERVHVSPADSSHSPDEGMTVGSMSMQTSGNAVRLAAAEARHHLLAVAFEELEAPVERLVVTDGTIHDPETGRNTSYWKLMGGKKFGRRVTGAVTPKRPEAYTIVGQPVGRLDLLAKVRGEPCFIHDLERPRMVHGRVVRPPHYHARLATVDADAVKQMPGVIKVVSDGSFLGVIAEREEQAVKAAEALREKAEWHGEANLPPQAELFDHMMKQPRQSFQVVDGTPVDGPVPEIERPGGARTVTAAYTRPFQMHAALGASAAVAQMVDGEMTVWTHSQGVYPTRTRIAQVLGMDEEKLRLIHVEGPGCYGHNGADDAALDAALLARSLPGRPVSLKWSRADENAWEPYGPAAIVKMQASLDREGRVVAWNHDVWGYPHFGRGRVEPETSGMIGAWHLAKSFRAPEPLPGMWRHVGVHRNADPLYAFPRRRVVKHFLAASPLRVSAQRGLGYYANVFAIESFMDELAHAAGDDPVAFRLRHLKDGRARAVVEAAADRANWQTGGRSGTNGRGQGIAFAQYKNIAAYAAVVVEVEVDPESGQIRLLRAVIAADAGQVVNPDGLSNQLEGGLVQAASWTLYEQVMFDRYGIISLDWTSYPILNLSNAPQIETVMLDRPGYPYLGSGEAAVGPTPAALANAVFHAAGIRLRDIPFTAERVRAAAQPGHHA